MIEKVPDRTLGAAAAAIVAAGIGCAALGLFTTLAEVSTGVKGWLNWYNPAGPLSGKTSMAVIVWLVAWALLHWTWKDKPVRFTRAFGFGFFLIILGWLFTFPPVFLAFHRS